MTPDTPDAPTIRAATPEDWPFISQLIPRLHEFGPPPWRDQRQMDAGVRRVLKDVVAAVPETSAVFVAESADGTPLGFVHLETTYDYFTRAAHGHVSDLIVARDGEGRGVGRALMLAAEAWARRQGFRMLTLNVFTTNGRARALYKRLGFGEDTMRYVKALDPHRP